MSAPGAGLPVQSYIVECGLRDIMIAEKQEVLTFVVQLLFHSRTQDAETVKSAGLGEADS
jgi:hypothetical protein